MAEQVESENGWCRFRIDFQLFHVNRVYYEKIPMWFMRGWRRGTDVAGDASVSGKSYRSLWKLWVFRIARVGCQFCCGDRDVEHCPMPESTCGRRVRVVAGDGETLCRVGKTMPFQVRRAVFPSCA